MIFWNQEVSCWLPIDDSRCPFECLFQAQNLSSENGGSVYIWEMMFLHCRKSRHLGKNGSFVEATKVHVKRHKGDRGWCKHLGSWRCWLSQVNAPCIGSLLEGITRLRVFQNCWKISKTPRIGCLMYMYIHVFVKCWVTNWYYIVNIYIYIPPIQCEYFLVFFSGSKLGFVSYCGSLTIEKSPILVIGMWVSQFCRRAFRRHPLCHFL